jgi:hypothetical protein
LSKSSPRCVTEAKATNELICNSATQLIQTTAARAAVLDASVLSDALRHLSEGRLASSERINELQSKLFIAHQRFRGAHDIQSKPKR